MPETEIIPHLFRTEYMKIVSVLSKRFGFAQIEVAEDIASETFLTAAQSWGAEGLPQNPVAWLYTVAKNKAKNFLRRDALLKKKIIPDLTVRAEQEEEYPIDLTPENIDDSQLQMMFAICQPSIPPEAQVGLSLRILCGFGIDEIANAFLTSKDTINKRLFRAKEKLREENVQIEMPSSGEIDNRLQPVLATIYLLFNEGYYSAAQTHPLRKELCYEAIRLCYLLIGNGQTNKPEVNALLSLMCFHASRFDARTNESGDLILYEEQDPAKWNADLISKGGYFLKCAASGSKLTRYHLEAGIAYWNTQKTNNPEKWEQILHFYNQLLQIDYSPVAALNRTYALAKVKGNRVAIEEAEKLQLENYHFYYALLGELYTGIDNARARHNYEKALALTKSENERNAIAHKLAGLTPY